MTILTTVSESTDKNDPHDSKGEHVSVQDEVESVYDRGVDVVRVLEPQHEEHAEQNEEQGEQPSSP